MAPVPADANAAAMQEGPRFGVVVIGRNEGERLVASLRALSPLSVPVVYVDSGSSDGSPARARSLVTGVLELDPHQPFTAARGRNEGHAYLRRLDDRIEFVQFVDGDTVLEPGWLAQGAAALRADPSIAAVAGRLEEGRSQDSRYGRLLRMEWEAPAGDTDSCGGIAMVRSAAFEDVGGFAADLAAGEEPELCARLRRAGHRIRRIDTLMAVHHGAIGSFAAWWRRAVRSGEASWECLRRGGVRWAAADLRRVTSAVLWGGAAPVVVAAGVVALAASGRLVPGTAVALAGAGLYVGQWRRICRARSAAGATADDARLYATFCLLSKPAELLGMKRAFIQSLRARGAGGRGARSRIEKAPR